MFVGDIHHVARARHEMLAAMGLAAFAAFRILRRFFSPCITKISVKKNLILNRHVGIPRAFWPAPVPFPVLHVDTGRNFAEVLEFRDRHTDDAGVRLDVAKVQDDIDAGRTVEDTSRSRTNSWPENQPLAVNGTVTTQSLMNFWEPASTTA